MKYDFTSVMERRHLDAMAIDAVADGLRTDHAPTTPKEGFDIIPMWVADMNFPTAPTIPAAIMERAKHPAYGYFLPTEAYFNGIIRWHETRSSAAGLTPACIGYENGVLGGVISALNVFCSRGDFVLLHSPAYIGFTITCFGSGWKRKLPCPATTISTSSRCTP